MCNESIEPDHFPCRLSRPSPQVLVACLPSGLRVEHDTTVAQNWRSGENEGYKMTNSHEAALSDNSYL